MKCQIWKKNCTANMKIRLSGIRFERHRKMVSFVAKFLPTAFELHMKKKIRITLIGLAR